MEKRPCFCLWGVQSCAVSIATEREVRERPKRCTGNDLWGRADSLSQPLGEFCLDSQFRKRLCGGFFQCLKGGGVGE